jgi:hypothetical protein
VRVKTGSARGVVEEGQCYGVEHDGCGHGPFGLELKYSHSILREGVIYGDVTGSDGRQDLVGW